MRQERQCLQGDLRRLSGYLVSVGLGGSIDEALRAEWLTALGGMLFGNDASRLLSGPVTCGGRRTVRRTRFGGKRSRGPFLRADDSRTLTSLMNETIDWMSTADAADYLGVQSRTLYRFIDEGRLPAYRFGRVIRLKRDDVDLFVQSCRIEPGTLIDTSSIASTTA